MLEQLSSVSEIFYAHVFGAPFYHVLVEVLLGILIIWLLRRKRYRPRDTLKLTEKEKEELIAEWEPEPLVPDTPPDHHALKATYIEGKLGKIVTVNGKECLNFATLNFLSLIGDERIETAAIQAVNIYGVGSCGPRGFYGTVDVHLNLEDELAQFMGCEMAVLYSYGFATVSSAIPAYAKRGDVIFCDKGVNFAIQKGLLASRSRIEFFEHNDMDDLERLLQLQAERDRQNPKKAKVTRRFLVAEGIYMNSGDICPLPKLIEFKWKYKVRVFIDESLSFGVLGATGRGVTEHYGISVQDVDMICASLEYAVASIGGFCCGRAYVIDHQRLSGLGYCFSASLPPLLAVAARESLRVMQQEPHRFHRLQQNSRLMQESLLSLQHFTISGQEGSPVFHLYLKQNLPREQKEHALESIAEQALQQNIVLTVARYLDNEELFLPEPSIRIAISCDLTAAEIETCVEAIRTASENVMRGQSNNVAKI